MKINAIVAGATGLVGSFLLKRLLEDKSFASVTVFARRPAGLRHPSLTEHIADFSEPSAWRHKVKGDVLFLCMGTTRAKAGGKRAQYRVDHDYQLELASAAADNGVRAVVLVSSAGAKQGSPFFYMRMKAEVERDIQSLYPENLSIIRPGPLTGPRREKRYAEMAGVSVISTLNRLGLLRRYRPVHADTVARAMVNAALKGDTGVKVYELSEVFDLAARERKSD